MTYLIIAILIVLYYLFGAPKSVKNTMNMITLVGSVALMIVLASLTFLKILQSPPEILIVIGMAVLAYFTLKDISRLGIKGSTTGK